MMSKTRASSMVERFRGVSRRGAVALLVAAALASARCTSTEGGRSESHGTQAASNASRENVLQYIDGAWQLLTRDPLNRGALVDPKLPPDQAVLYLPANEPTTETMRTATTSFHVQIKHLAMGLRVGNADPRSIHPPGLLYLPHPYVVPGGRFNEMYGWDSFFILEGLLQPVNGKLNPQNVQLARGMTENFFYELAHYGAVLNANRTYYLTRSQPPFLTSMVLDVEAAMKQVGQTDPEWIAKGYRAAEADWTFWNRPEQRAGDTGLARYFDYGTGPVPEMHDDPTYYQNVIHKLLQMGDRGRAYLRPVQPGEKDIPQVKDSSTGRAVTLTDEFYKGDRAMRESGFDVSFRFGPYGADTHHYAAVGLNSLLYKEERDLAAMAERLGKQDEAALWNSRAEARRKAIQKYLWSEDRGLFVDYDFTTHKQSSYEFATMFWPLWAGIATEGQASRVERHLKDLERAGGLATSTHKTGVQWDYPFGWAPLQMLAVDGLRRYGYQSQASGLAEKWLRTIVLNFRREGTLREKYNVVTRSADVNVQVGYSQNVVGFGWTNGVFLKLLNELPAAEQKDVLR